MNSEIKYPNVEVELANQDGNAFAIIGRVSKAMRIAKVSSEEIDKYRKESMAGDYDNLLQVTMSWVTVL